MLRRFAATAVLTLVVLSVFATTIWAHGGEEGEASTSYSIYALAPAGLGLVATAYIMYRIFKGKPSE